MIIGVKSDKASASEIGSCSPIVVVKSEGEAKSESDLSDNEEPFNATQTGRHQKGG